MTLTLEWACGFEQFGCHIAISLQVAEPWTAELIERQLYEHIDHDRRAFFARQRRYAEGA